MPSIRCFFLEPTDQVENSLRRYVWRAAAGDGAHFHDADVVIGRGPESDSPKLSDGKPVHGDVFPHDDPRWPTACACGYVFVEADEWQYNPHALYRRADTGELMTLGRAPAGAMWFAPWLSEVKCWQGPDGKTLVVRLPPDGHDWIIDSRAKNCTMPDDDVHKCWVRHGEPPDVTVDKSGHTCSAGAGSIATPKWHGFLRNGWLVE